ncbi:type III-A CRISPR-associated protein Cas10/Csm1 [Brachyspira pulli]|uniref:type III-A CRISPR-associated protein Cas10/Csm1 n=1 Tax=Brachyspira pulli TaxID=310721 RepID=UPI003005A080
MNIDESKYKDFLLRSIFYDIDSIISFFGESSIVCQNFFCQIKSKIGELNKDYDDLLSIVSKELESIILNSNNLVIDNNKALKSIFTIFKENSNDKKKIDNVKYYPLDMIRDNIIYPDELSKTDANSFLNNDIKYLESINLENVINEPNIILNVISSILSYVPYYKSEKEYGIGDISFYDKLKINTALSSCLYLLKSNNLDAEDGKYFALLSADISGIQKFIYTISSKGALKSLRARSFYLEIMLEHIVDEILEYFKLKRCNLLYTGGGHFYILLPNYKDLKDSIVSIKEKINDWFIKEFSVDLYIAMDYIDFSFDDLKNTKNVFKGLSKKLSIDKQNRYNKKQLNNLLFPRENEADFECSICNTSSKSTKERDEDELGYVCDTCYNLYKAGKYIINENDNITIINSQNNLDAKKIINLPSISESRYLYFGSIDASNNSVVRIYSKNNSNDKHINLYLGNYNYRKEGKEDLSSFEELIEGTKGIKRIGVLRCDVDNLGQAFINGFKDYSDIFRTSVLSRHLSLFFKYYINSICKGDVQFPNNKLFGDEYYNKEKHVVIVYSGGDDVFLVGYWLDVIDFSFDLREAFKRYTNDKLTFSAGIGFFHSSYPISKMASQTGELEELSKNHKYDNKEKDSISLFGIPNNDYNGRDFEYCFNWKEFDKVREKINFIFNTCYFDEAYQNEDKVFFSTSFIYRLKQLIDIEKLKNDKINISRLAYSLARIKSSGSEKYIENYEKFKTNIYNWFFDSTERKYLNTALDLIVYLNRVDSND